MSSEDLDPENIDKAVQICESKGANIIFGGIVTKIHDRKGSAKRILIVSDSFITYVKKPKNPVLSRTHSWKDLTFINIINQDGIEMLFNQDKFRFTSEQTPQIARKILDLLLHTLSTKKVSQLDLARFPHCNVSVNPRGILSRLDCQLISNNIQPNSSKFRKLLRSNLEQRNPTFKATLSEDEDPIILTSSLLYSLIPSPTTHGIFLPEIKDNEIADKIYPYASDFIKKATVADFLNFEMPITKTFANFTEKFTEIATTHVNGIGFSSIEVNEESINMVSNFLDTGKIISLRWTNINPITSIETLLTNKSYTNKLRYIALDKTKGLRFDKIAPLLSQVVVLSLEYCDLELSDAFKIISENSFPELKLLDLSYNNSSTKIDTSIIIPSTIERIDISYVKFSHGTMKDIFEFILSSTYDHGLKFYCDKYCVRKQDQVDVALSYLNQISKTPLVEFSWRKNKITKELLQYLAKNKSLTKLIFEGNVVKNDEMNTVPEFVEICGEFTNLTHLYINGNKKNNFASAFGDVLNAIKKLPKIEFLDISKNSIGDEGFDLLSASLKELPSLKYIVFDSNKPKTIQSIHNFILASNQLNRTIHVSYPQNDIESLLKKKKIDENGIENVKNALKSLLIEINNENQTAQTSKLLPTSFDDSNAKIPKPRNASKRNSIRSKRNSIRLSNSKQPQAISAYIRAGSVRNVKRPLLAGESSQQDPESLFIKPFDMWYASIDDNNFPLYLTEQLENELSIGAHDTVAILEQEESKPKKAKTEQNEEESENEVTKQERKKKQRKAKSEQNEEIEEEESENENEVTKQIRKKKQRKTQQKEIEEIEEEESDDDLTNEKIDKKLKNEQNEEIQKENNDANELTSKQNEQNSPNEANEENNSQNDSNDKTVKNQNENELNEQIKNINNDENEQIDSNEKQNKGNKKKNNVKKHSPKGQSKERTETQNIQQRNINLDDNQQKSLNPPNKKQNRSLKQIKTNNEDNQTIKNSPKRNQNESPMTSPGVIKPVTPAPQLLPIDQVIQPLPVIEKIENVRNSPKSNKQSEFESNEVQPISHIGSNSSESLNDNDSFKERDIQTPIESDSDDLENEIPAQVSSNRRLPPLPQKRAPAPQLSPIVKKPDFISSSSSDLSFNEIENESPSKKGKAAAPELEINEFDDDIVDDVPFEPLSWSFPIPRTTRVSNKKLLQELNEKYSTPAVINAIKTRK